MLREVSHWFAILANADSDAATEIFDRMPLYTEYIRSRSLDAILSVSTQCLQTYRGLNVSIEQAAKMSPCLGQTTILPLAVACEYLHHGCGFPAVFAFDLFQACLASCQHKALEIALYAAKSTSFTCKARWWACPTGDPNAGTSPTFFFHESFRNHGRVAAFFHGPSLDWSWQQQSDSKPAAGIAGDSFAAEALDPNFPTKKTVGTVDTGKYLDLTRRLESANGGKFEWGTGAEEMERQKRKTCPATASVDQTATPLAFDPTNINMCLFQQFSLFEEWWCQVEALHKCGFSAQVLMTPTERAIVDRTVGLQDPAPIAALLQKIWAYVASTHGPQCGMPAHQLMPSAPAQNMIRSLYYNLDEEDRKGGWGSATKAAIGKMEYHMPTAACLATLASCALDPASFSPTMDDNAIKCAVQHFVLRVCYSCTIVDATVHRLHVKPKAGQATFSPRAAVRPMTARVLEICLKNPILESHLSSHFGTLKGAYKSQDRIAVMKELEHLGLGEVKEARRKPGSEQIHGVPSLSVVPCCVCGPPST